MAKAASPSGKGAAKATNSKAKARTPVGKQAKDAPLTAAKKRPVAKSPARRTFTVFLDRDGVFNEDPRIGARFPRQLRFLPGAVSAFARLNQPHIQTCLATNQPWVGMGTATTRMIQRVNAHLKVTLEEAGGRLDRIEAAFAPPFFATLGKLLGKRVRHAAHRRKPRPGMLEDAAAAFELQGHRVDKSKAVMVGDRVKDAQAAAAFGIPCILLATTDDAATLEAKARHRDVPYLAIAPDLETAVDLILAAASQA